MNKKRIIAFSAALAIALTTMPVFIHGDEKTYDPEGDPVISLSYLNGVFAPVYDKKISDAEEKIAALETKVGESETKTATLETKVGELEIKLTEAESRITNLEILLAQHLDDESKQPANTYEVICLKENQKLMAKSPLEIILRSGTAITVSITSNGVNDLTGGVELHNTDAVPLYHQLLVPRGDDGRGLQVTSAESYIMVRGDYEIVD